MLRPKYPGPPPPPPALLGALGSEEVMAGLGAGEAGSCLVCPFWFWSHSEQSLPWTWHGARPWELTGLLWCVAGSASVYLLD